MADMGQIGKNIREYREKCGVTQRELADKLLVSFQAISAWERGMSIPDLENAVRLAEFFDVSVDTMLGRQNVPIYVGVDGGGTKTEFVLFQADGTVLDTLVKGGSNPNDRGMDDCLRVLTEGLEQLLRGRTLRAVFTGIGGVSLVSYQKIITHKLAEHFRCDAYAESDATNVLSMGTDPENSMAVICGTGSCVFMRKGMERHRIGGWGYLLDPAGSAYDVGREALREALAVQDGLKPSSLLAERVSELLSGDVYDNISKVYIGGRAYVASLARMVTELAAEGEPASLAILRENAGRLAFLIQKTMEAYGTPTQVVGGGSFLECDLYRKMIEEQAGITFEMPGLPPVYGACVEVLRRENVIPGENFRENFMNSYRR